MLLMNKIFIKTSQRLVIINAEMCDMVLFCIVKHDEAFRLLLLLGHCVCINYFVQKNTSLTTELGLVLEDALEQIAHLSLF